MSSPFKKLFTSTLGHKYLMSLTGLALVGFLIVHLLGNLQLLLPTGEWFNKYAHHLVSLGPFLWLTEIGLLAIVGLHVVLAIISTLTNQQARPVGYYGGEKSKGGPSHSNLSSRNMLILGVVILVFMVVHVWQFRFGPNVADGYVAQVHGEDVRDLYRLVMETFSHLGWVLFYVGSIVFVAFHVRHGVWSAFQSLGAMPGVLSKSIYVVGAVLAVLLAVGFILMPIWLYIVNTGVFK